MVYMNNAINFYTLDIQDNYQKTYVYEAPVCKIVNPLITIIASGAIHEKKEFNPGEME